MIQRSLLAAVMVVFALGANAASAKSGFCPPGLAKKAVPCVPPGQVGKSSRSDHDDDDEDHDHVFGPGDWLPDDVRYIIVTDYGRYGLAPPAFGSEYLRIGDRFYRVGTETRQIIELVQILGSLLN